MQELLQKAGAGRGQVFGEACEEVSTGQPASSRGCRYALNTLMQTFLTPAMATSIAAGTLRGCIAALLACLLDERVPSLPEGTNLLKALNVLMLRILDHSNR